MRRLTHYYVDVRYRYTYGGAEFKAGFWNIPAYGTTPPAPALPSWIKYNATLAVAQGPWSVSVVGRNLTNRATLVSTPIVGYIPGSAFQAIESSRTILLQANYEF